MAYMTVILRWSEEGGLGPWLPYLTFLMDKRTDERRDWSLFLRLSNG